MYKRIPRLLLTALVIAASYLTTPGQERRTPPSPPSARQVTKADLDERFASARSLARQGKYEEALRDYLFVFDNSRGVGSYGGVRLSYVPGEIAGLGEKYPPALLALRERRDEREGLILAGRAGFDEIHELTSLNQYLGEAKRSVELYDKVKKLGPAWAEARDDLLGLIWEDLVEAKRYDEVGGKVVQLAKRVAGQIAEYQINQDFPTGDVFDRPEYKAFLRMSVLRDGGRAFEVLLAVKKDEEAERLVNWLLVFQSDGQMFANLVDHAVKSGRSDVARDLVQRGLKALKTERDLEDLRAAEKRIP